MFRSRLSVLAVAVMTLSAPVSGVQHLCSGFLPENDMRIPIGAPIAGGLTESDFNAVLDKVEAYYRPIIQRKGGTLKVNRYWTDDTVNASANQMGSTWAINMYGGLARHPQITKDGFMLVACHEIGHHIGGAPKGAGWFGVSWATNEGGADYFATLRCMRFMHTAQENMDWVTQNAADIDPVAKLRCEEIYQTQDEENICIRSSMAGMSGTMLFYAMRQQEKPPMFNTPDPKIVGRMDDAHPATQCRLDTYYNGALCVNDLNVELSDTNPNVGTCTAANGQRDGLRPLCWFKP